MIPAPIVQEMLSIDTLNELFTPLTFQERIDRLYQIFDTEEVLVTSSFGTKSVFLLYFLSQIKAEQRIHFIDTTYHFKETLDYKKELTEMLDLEVIEVLPGQEENLLTLQDKWWKDHPKMCCTINKTAPLEPIIAKHKLWMSSLMGYQTPFRAHLRVFEQQGDIIKFHPLVDIDEGEFLFHMRMNRLPAHPLEKHGYGSIGCVHCTAKGDGRSGRWKGSEKTECGLHPSYFVKK